MGIIRLTAHPSWYADEDDALTEEELLEQGLQYEQKAVGTFYCRVELLGASSWEARAQRDISRVLSKALGQKAIYQKKEQYYHIGNWSVCCGNVVNTERFDITDMGKILHAFAALSQAGYLPNKEICIYFKPEQYDQKLILNILSLMEARMPLIVQALNLRGEIQIIIDHDLTFSVELNVFDLDVIEACIFLLRQVSLRAVHVRNVRTQLCDMSNPKYQMRTWLLRLGFVGDEYQHSRKTLMQNLEGNSAFFDEKSKRKAEYNRKAQRLTI